MRARPSLPAVDYIKSAAILAVLVNHAVPALLDRPLIPSETMILGLVSFHVPAFLFLAGFLSHAETVVRWREVGVRLRRVVPPYLVATAIAAGLGFVPVPTFRRSIFVTATGAAFGHYYFVPILACCLLALPLLSRLATRVLIGGTLLMLVVGEAMYLVPAWRLSQSLFWMIRDPLLQFHLGFFVLGIIAARRRQALERLGTRHRSLVLTIAGPCILLFAGAAHATEAVFQPAVRALYTLMVMTVIALAIPPNAAPASVRSLSALTFTIYLYHWFAYAAVTPLIPHGTPIVLRIVGLVVVGLAFTLPIALLGRRALGARSRVLLGA